MTRALNWLAAHRQVFGEGVPALWLHDLDMLGMEMYITAHHELVLVDRTPVMVEGHSAWLRRTVQHFPGFQASPVGDIRSIDLPGLPPHEVVLHGIHSGLLAGAAVLMDQYVHLRHGSPIAVVRIVGRVNGTGFSGPGDHVPVLRKLLVDEGNDQRLDVIHP